MTPGGFSPSDLEAFRAAVGRTIGLRFDNDKLPLLSEVLAARVRHTGARTPAAYISTLAPSSKESAALARSLTVGETYFLRDRGQFAAFAQLLRRREALGARQLRILSAGCASGEEAYSLALTVRETLPDPSTWTISIVGVDLDPDAIERARAGEYTKWSLRATPDHLRARYFVERGDGKFAVTDALHAMVRFAQGNLHAPPGQGVPWAAQAYDVVLCRNVLMYFTRPAARAVAAKIGRALVPGGFLFLGHAENLRGLSEEFLLRQAHGTFYYERKGAAGEEDPRPVADGWAPAVDPTPSTEPSWLDAIARASARIETLATSAGPQRGNPPSDTAAAAADLKDEEDVPAVIALMRQDRFVEALQVLDHAAPTTSPSSARLLLRAMLLLSTGDFEGAQCTCMALLDLDDLEAGAHYVVALCREHAGDRPAAVDHHRAAAYLDAAFALPHLQLGRLARRDGELALARRELTLALDLLPQEDAARLFLFGGGFDREALIRVCRRELDACEGGP